MDKIKDFYLNGFLCKEEFPSQLRKLVRMNEPDEYENAWTSESDLI